MPKGILNWKFQDVARFLKDHNFRMNHVEGSHYFYTGYVGKILRQVCVPFHGSKSIKPRTMKGIINQSGITKKEWLD